MTITARKRIKFNCITLSYIKPKQYQSFKEQKQGSNISEIDTKSRFLQIMGTFAAAFDGVILAVFLLGLFTPWVTWKVKTNSCCYFYCHRNHYNDVIMGTMMSQITSLTIVYSAVYSGADQRKYQSSASLAFVREIHRWPVNSPHKWPVTRKTFPFDDIIMLFLSSS